MSHGKRQWIAVVGAAVLVLTLASGAVAAVVVTDPSTPPTPPIGAAGNLGSMPDLQHRPVVLPAVFTRPKAITLKLTPAAFGISAVALTAYRRAAHLEARLDPGCRIPWQLIASIGYIESDHGQFGGDSLDVHGNETTPIEGIPLDGTSGIARITDGKGRYVHAEGPLQFIPSTWAAWRADGNGDGRQDPQNIFDASAAAAAYLCSSGQDLSLVLAQPPAITLYNDSPIYVKNVTNVERAYLAGLSADTVTLIPMPTCPAPNAKPAPTAVPTPSPTPGVMPCPPTSPKKPTKAKAKAQPVAARTNPIVEASRPTPSPSPTRTPKPTPSPSPTPSISPTPPAPTPSP